MTMNIHWSRSHRFISATTNVGVNGLPGNRLNLRTHLNLYSTAVEPGRLRLGLVDTYYAADGLQLLLLCIDMVCLHWYPR